MNIVILSAAPGSEATKSIIRAGEKRKHQMTVLNPEHLYLLISDSVNGYDRIFDGYNKDNKPDRIKAKDVNAVISRIGNNLDYGAAVLQHFRENLKVFTTQTPHGITTAADKLLSLQKISAAKIKVPKTIIADNGVHLDFMVDQVGGLPAIAKTIFGSQGIGVIPLESKLQTNATLESFHKNKIKIILQQMIDGGAKDIRAIVIDGKVITAMERTAPKGDLRANISLGGSGRKVDLTDADKDICIRAAEACGLAVAGVDIMKDKEGTTYVIEVNSNYGYHVETITGDDISTPLIEYCENNATGKINVSNDPSSFSKEILIETILLMAEHNKIMSERCLNTISLIKSHAENKGLSIDDNLLFLQNLIKEWSYGNNKR
jgi:ribosomal protein S6--L-glutamate ligase